MPSVLTIGLVVAVLWLIAFIIFREFFTWYWKQSEQVRLLKRIAERLEAMDAPAAPAAPRPAPAPVAPPFAPAPGVSPRDLATRRPAGGFWGAVAKVVG